MEWTTWKKREHLGALDTEIKKRKLNVYVVCVVVLVLRVGTHIKDISHICMQHWGVPAWHDDAMHSREPDGEQT